MDSTKKPQRTGRNKVENSEYDSFVNQLERVSIGEKRTKSHPKKCDIDQKSSQTTPKESGDPQIDEDPYQPEVNGKYKGASKFKDDKNSQMESQGCKYSVVDELHHTSPVCFDDEKSENLCTANFCAKDSQVEQETGHLLHDVTLEDSHAHIENEYIDLGNEEGLDISDDWTSVESEAGLAGPVRRIEGVALVDREIRRGTLVLV
jgi:hypothetical protein